MNPPVVRLGTAPISLYATQLEPSLRNRSSRVRRLPRDRRRIARRGHGYVPQRCRAARRNDWSEVIERGAGRGFGVKEMMPPRGPVDHQIVRDDGVVGKPRLAARKNGPHKAGFDQRGRNFVGVDVASGVDHPIQMPLINQIVPCVLRHHIANRALAIGSGTSFSCSRKDFHKTRHLGVAKGGRQFLTPQSNETPARRWISQDRAGPLIARGPVQIGNTLSRRLALADRPRQPSPGHIGLAPDQPRVPKGVGQRADALGLNHQMLGVFSCLNRGHDPVKLGLKPCHEQINHLAGLLLKVTAILAQLVRLRAQGTAKSHKVFAVPCEHAHEPVKAVNPVAPVPKIRMGDSFCTIVQKGITGAIGRLGTDVEGATR